MQEDASKISKAVIEIDKKYGTSITIVKEGGVSSKKYSNIESVQEVLLENFQFATGWVPSGTRYYKRGDECETIFIESPPSVRRVAFQTGNGSKEFTIPVPWTLWRFTLTHSQGRHKVGNAAVWAMKNPITPGKEASHPLYKFPFSNVSGGICWGGSSQNREIMDSIDQIGKIGRMIEVFWSAPFNSDLDGNKYTPFQNDNDVTISNCHGFFEYLDGKETFRYGVLVEETKAGSIIR
jgi:hypothetical protein